MSNESVLTRLRRANPVAATAVGTPELFDRITSQPSDPRLARDERARPRRKRALVLALAAVLAALLASTAFAVSRLLGGDVVRPPVTMQEYRDAQKVLALPPGATWPKLHRAPGNTVTTRGGGGGAAVLIAMNAWECYWVGAIKRGDAAAGREAHAQLDKLLANNVLEAPLGASENWTPTPLPTHPFVAFAHDGGLAWIRNNYVQAAAGHPAGLAQSCRANR
jgi:hypothetical protein